MAVLPLDPLGSPLALTGNLSHAAAHQQPVNVKYYGAKGDGTTNDTAAFTLAEAAAGTGGTIFVPTGTYRLLDYAPTTDNLTIQGQGWGTVLKAYSGATFTLALRGLRGCVVRDLKIDGNANASIGLRLQAAVGGAGAASFLHQMNHIWIANCTTCIDLPDPGATDQVDKNLYIGCFITDSTTGLSYTATNSQSQEFIGCHFSTLTTGVLFNAGSSGGTFRMQGGEIVAITTAIQINTTIRLVELIDMITEQSTHDIVASGVASWPSLGLHIENCTLQGSSESFVCPATNTPVLHIERSTVGALNMTGSGSAMIYDVLNTTNLSVTVGTNTFRVKQGTGSAITTFNGVTTGCVVRPSLGTLGPQAAVTASRPSAVTAGAGQIFYDTTLSKPIFSDGTVWRDAAGTAV